MTKLSSEIKYRLLLAISQEISRSLDLQDVLQHLCHSGDQLGFLFRCCAFVRYLDVHVWHERSSPFPVFSYNGSLILYLIATILKTNVTAMQVMTAAISFDVVE
jgi:hypothetical protein